MIIIYVENRCAVFYFYGNWYFFQDSLMIKMFKKQHLFEIEILINVDLFKT